MPFDQTRVPKNEILILTPKKLKRKYRINIWWLITNWRDAYYSAPPLLRKAHDEKKLYQYSRAKSRLRLINISMQRGSLRPSREPYQCRRSISKAMSGLVCRDGARRQTSVKANVCVYKRRFQAEACGGDDIVSCYRLWQISASAHISVWASPSLKILCRSFTCNTPFSSSPKRRIGGMLTWMPLRVKQIDAHQTLLTVT